PTDETGHEVGDDIAVQVREHEDVVQLGLLYELHAHVVDDAVLKFDVRVLLRDLAGDLQKESVRELHDVGLVHGGHLAALVRAVVSGPLRPTLLRRIESSAAFGNGSPCFCSAGRPMSCTSHSMATPVASIARRVAATISGPVPSPGMSVMRCVAMARPPLGL